MTGLLLKREREQKSLCGWWYYCCCDKRNSSNNLFWNNIATRPSLEGVLPDDEGMKACFSGEEEEVGEDAGEW